MKYLNLIIVLLIPYWLLAQKNFTVSVHEFSGPDGMNPLTSTSANALYMQGNVFQKLLEYDAQTLQLRPVLAKALPTIKEVKKGKYKGGMSITYEIHPDAVWDDGTEVTADDYVFTIKAIKNPRVHADYIRPYVEFIDKIVIDKKNYRKFTIYASEVYCRGIEATGEETFILPEYHYDPTMLMRNFSIKELNDLDKQEELKKHPAIIEFADNFNDAKYVENPKEIVGSGPYYIEEWTRYGGLVSFKKKKKWWGDKVKDNPYLVAYPSEIRYESIPDMDEAIQQAREGELDVIRSISPNRFEDLKEDETFKRDFDFGTTEQFAYHYLGLNTKLPKLQDVRVRKAIAHAVDREAIIELFKGAAVKINGPILPIKDYYNDAVKDMELDLEQAKAYLTDAGWKDSDGDGILDKMIDGKLEQLSLEFNYNQGHAIRKAIGQLLRDNLKQLKIELNIVPVSFPILLDKADNRDFEIMALAWVKTAGLDNLEQVWHSASDKKGGSNRVGFGDAASDEIIEKIKITIDEEKRKALYLEIQQKIADAQCYIFLVMPKDNLILSKKFKHPALSPIRPGYRARFFQLK